MGLRMQLSEELGFSGEAERSLPDDVTGTWYGIDICHRITRQQDGRLYYQGYLEGVFIRGFLEHVEKAWLQVEIRQLFLEHGGDELVWSSASLQRRGSQIAAKYRRRSESNWSDEFFANKELGLFLGDGSPAREE